MARTGIVQPRLVLEPDPTADYGAKPRNLHVKKKKRTSRFSIFKDSQTQEDFEIHRRDARSLVDDESYPFNYSLDLRIFEEH